MKPVFRMLALSAVVLAAQGCALQPSTSGSVATGTVTGIFREVRPSVLVATDVNRGDLSHPLWVQVTLAEPLPDGSTSTTARTEPGLTLELGDMVALDLARRGPAAGLLPRPTMVAAVIDRNDRYARGPAERAPTAPTRSSRVSTLLQTLEPYTAKP